MIDEIIKKRRSVRIFSDQAVEKEKIEKLIEAATYAPSACNVQGWKFIVVDRQEIKDEIVDLGGSIHIKNAPVGILALYDNRTKNSEYRDDIQSASAAIQNIHLTAVDLGLASCWACHLPTHGQLRKLLKIPSYFSPIAYILLGYSKNPPQEVPRKYSLGEVMNYNEFSKNWPVDKISFLKLIIQRLLIKIYRFTPKIIKKKILNKILDKNFVKKFEN